MIFTPPFFFHFSCIPRFVELDYPLERKCNFGVEKCNLLQHTTIIYSTDSHEYLTLVRNELRLMQQHDKADLFDIALSLMKYEKERKVSYLVRSL